MSLVRAARSSDSFDSSNPTHVNLDALPPRIRASLERVIRMAPRDLEFAESWARTYAAYKTRDALDYKAATGGLAHADYRHARSRIQAFLNSLWKDREAIAYLAAIPKAAVLFSKDARFADSVHRGVRAIAENRRDILLRYLSEDGAKVLAKADRLQAEHVRRQAGYAGRNVSSPYQDDPSKAGEFHDAPEGMGTLYAKGVGGRKSPGRPATGWRLSWIRKLYYDAYRDLQDGEQALTRAEKGHRLVTQENAFIEGLLLKLIDPSLSRQDSALARRRPDRSYLGLKVVIDAGERYLAWKANLIANMRNVSRAARQAQAAYKKMSYAVQHPRYSATGDEDKELRKRMRETREDIDRLRGEARALVYKAAGVSSRNERAVREMTARIRKTGLSFSQYLEKEAFRGASARFLRETAIYDLPVWQVEKLYGQYFHGEMYRTTKSGEKIFRGVSASLNDTQKEQLYRYYHSDVFQERLGLKHDFRPAWRAKPAPDPRAEDLARTGGVLGRTVTTSVHRGIRVMALSGVPLHSTGSGSRLGGPDRNEVWMDQQRLVRRPADLGSSARDVKARDSEARKALSDLRKSLSNLRAKARKADPEEARALWQKYSLRLKASLGDKNAFLEDWSHRAAEKEDILGPENARNASRPTGEYQDPRKSLPRRPGESRISWLRRIVTENRKASRGVGVRTVTLPQRYVTTGGGRSDSRTLVFPYVRGWSAAKERPYVVVNLRGGSRGPDVVWVVKPTPGRVGWRRVKRLTHEETAEAYRNAQALTPEHVRFLKHEVRYIPRTLASPTLGRIVPAEEVREYRPLGEPTRYRTRDTGSHQHGDVQTNPRLSEERLREAMWLREKLAGEERLPPMARRAPVMAAGSPKWQPHDEAWYLFGEKGPYTAAAETGLRGESEVYWFYNKRRNTWVRKKGVEGPHLLLRHVQKRIEEARDPRELHQAAYRLIYYFRQGAYYAGEKGPQTGPPIPIDRQPPVRELIALLHERARQLSDPTGVMPVQTGKVSDFASLAERFSDETRFAPERLWWLKVYNRYLADQQALHSISAKEHEGLEKLSAAERRERLKAMTADPRFRSSLVLPAELLDPEERQPVGKSPGSQRNVYGMALFRQFVRDLGVGKYRDPETYTDMEVNFLLGKIVELRQQGVPEPTGWRPGGVARSEWRPGGVGGKPLRKPVEE